MSADELVIYNLLEKVYEELCKQNRCLSGIKEEVENIKRRM